jgi:hypothetical protein
MGWTFHDIETLPAPYEIVWCKWPYREDKGQPGKDVRPVLVRASELREYADGTQFGALVVSYGTSKFTEADSEADLIIRQWEIGALGLHKPTRFSMAPQHRKLLPWCEEYFVPPAYVVNHAGLVLGKLSEAQIGRMKACWKKRGINGP